MKKIKFILTLIFIFLIANLTYNITFSDDFKIYGKYTVGNLTFTSYSKSWDDDKLKLLYLELLNNFHGPEFDYLKNIYIYPDSMHGVNGHYNEDIKIENGAYKFGKNSYIEIFNGEKLNTIEKIAPVLSHEYGHHYTFYNLLNYEGVYYNNFKESEYYKIRQLDKYPVLLEYTNENDYIYHWDITELLADDYVQLLGSSNAKKSTDFKDLQELLLNNESLPNFYSNSFNLKPQVNPYLPLASEVEGLYNYFLKIAGFTSSKPTINKLPVIENVQASKNSDNSTRFTVSWLPGEGSGTLEYTLVAYPLGNPFSPIPIKTVTDKENLTAIFGSYSITEKNGLIKNISQSFPNEIELKIYVKDQNNYIYSSDSYYVNLKTLENSIESTPNTSQKNNIKNNKKTNIAPSTVKPSSNKLSNEPNDKKPYVLANTFTSLIKNIKKSKISL